MRLPHKPYSPPNAGGTATRACSTGSTSYLIRTSVIETHCSQAQRWKRLRFQDRIRLAVGQGDDLACRNCHTKIYFLWNQYSVKAKLLGRIRVKSLSSALHGAPISVHSRAQLVGGGRPLVIGVWDLIGPLPEMATKPLLIVKK